MAISQKCEPGIFHERELDFPVRYYCCVSSMHGLFLMAGFTPLKLCWHSNACMPIGSFTGKQNGSFIGLLLHLCSHVGRLTVFSRSRDLKPENILLDEKGIHFHMIFGFKNEFHFPAVGIQVISG